MDRKHVPARRRGRGSRARGIEDPGGLNYMVRRDTIHGEWNHTGRDVKNQHFSLVNNPEGNRRSLRTIGWEPIEHDVGLDESVVIRQGNGGEEDVEMANDLQAQPGVGQATVFRQNELTRLQMYGETTVNRLARNYFCEASWGFMGMHNIEPGPAWSTFHYALSDLYLMGFMFASQVCAAIMEICEDVVAIGQTTGHHLRDRVCYLAIEGRTDIASAHRDFFTMRGMTLGEISVDPTQLLERLIETFISERDEDENNGIDLLFKRVFIHVMSDAGRGGSLEEMPYWMQQLRGGKFYKEVKGYQCIPDSKDNLCGLEALVWGLANAFTRIQKMCKKVEKTVPELCIRLRNYRNRIYMNGKKQKQILQQLKEEMVSMIDYTPGSPLSHEQLCMIMSTFTAKYELDIGLVIFDAIHPLTTYSLNYDPKKKVPEEIVCLVHWNYSLPQYAGVEEIESIPSLQGHYDCLNSCNVTKWLTQKHPSAYSRNLRFSFRSMSLLTPGQADDKGNWCFHCRHWQKSTSNDLQWKASHGFCPQTEVEFACELCGVTFNSAECEALHKKKSHGLAVSACDHQAYCLECKKIHPREKNCNEWYCAVCYQKYSLEEKSTHVCYLRPASAKKSKRIEMVIYADMEGSRKNGHHEGVCISCYWTTICAEHKNYRNKSSKTKKKCQDCLLHTDNWEWFCNTCLEECSADEASNECPECLMKHSKYFSGRDSLIRFLDWVMTYHLGATVIFHNGGKYDLHILVPVILGSGRYYIANDANRSTQIIFMSIGVMRSESDLLEEKSKKKKLSANKYVHFKDSLNFIQSSLRNFNEMFELGASSKGRFPYDLLNIDGWEEWDGTVPDMSYFGIKEKELKNMNMLSKNRQKEITGIQEYIQECKQEEEKGIRWNALEKLKEYTLMDTEVLHDGCEMFRRQFWNLVGHDPFQYVTLPAAVAGAYRSPRYMPPDSIQIFPVMDREWQHKGLRGGRCEMFKAYWKKTKPTEQFRWVDINSEYPAVQAYGHYPMGAMTVELKYESFRPYSQVSAEFYQKTGRLLEDVLQTPDGTHGCGLIECEFQTANDIFVPILPCRIKTKSQVNGKQGYQKNVFQICSSSSIFFLTVVAEAVRAKQIIITGIKRLQYWGHTSDKLFQSYMCQLYAAKVQASGWKKILNKDEITDRDKKEFINECKKRGIVVEEDKITDNPGLRTTAKIMNNCGWGFLCKKLTTDDTLYFNNFDAEDVEDMVELITDLEKNNGKRMKGVPVSVENYTKIRSTKVPELVTVDEMDKRVAYHVGGQVPAYGLQKITTGLLSLHSSQIVYCDTDSIAYVYDSDNPEHKEIPTGVYLGDYLDEYPKHDIEEFVSTGCKSYYVKMRDRKDEKKVQYKGRFKGLPFNSAAFSLTDKNHELAQLGMEEMKNLLFNALERMHQSEEKKEDVMDELTYEFHYTNFFKRGTDHKITAREEHKTVRFTYDKRKILLPDDWSEGWQSRIKEIQTVPLNDNSSQIQSKNVSAWLEENIANRIGDPSIFVD